MEIIKPNLQTVSLQCPVHNKNDQTCEGKGKYDPQSREKSANEKIPEVIHMLELAEKNFVMTIINMLAHIDD